MPSSVDVQFAHFGALAIPVFPDSKLSLTARGQVYDSVLIQTSAASQMSMTLFAAPTSGGYTGPINQANLGVAAAAGAEAVVGRAGPMGNELIASMRDNSTVSFLTVAGYRWVLRTVITSAPGRESIDILHARKVISWVTVQRGNGAYPPGHPVALQLPEDYAQAN